MTPDETDPPAAETELAVPTPPAAPAKRSRSKAKPKEEPPPAVAAPPAEDEPTAPKRAKLPEERARLLKLRRTLDAQRPIFGRQAANRYFRIGRDGAWRRPRGLQSKQRRHYGYRPTVVSVGYRSPARVRGLVPSGFRPVIVRTTADLEGLNATIEAAVIARTVGTRRRLALEEDARRLGIRVLNPIVTSDAEA